MLTNLFYLLRPLIDFLGSFVLIILCLGSTLFAVVMLVKKFWKYFIAIGIGGFVFFIIYLSTNGFALLGI